MNLELLYYDDKVTVLNPSGTVGILTLWSKTDVILKKFGKMPPCVAAISSFFGDGISQLLVNLLNNPQITHLFLVGNNRTDSATELLNYFRNGVEEVKINGSVQYRIIGTTRLVNAALANVDLFDGRLINIGTFYKECDGVVPSLDKQIETLRSRLINLKQVEHRLLDRKPIKLIEQKTETFPSIRQGHQVISDNILDAWGELLFLIKRFGLSTTLAKGERKELMNLKVVITNPKWMSKEDYIKYNLDVDKMQGYCEELLNPVLDDDTTYTYGNRLKEYFGYDMINKVVHRLMDDIEDRKSYISLWDSQNDMNDSNIDGSLRGHPCWVGGFFRVYDGALTLSATFRTHRAFLAWIENTHGLMHLQQMVAEQLNLSVGPLTIFSYSISIDPDQLSLVDSITNGRKWRLRDDGRGEVVFSVNNGKAVVEHRIGGIVLKRYESANIEALSHQLAQDYLISDLNHAIYVGKQIGKIQMCLKYSLPYEES